jgi:uncharacterized protein YbjT (DUF2867 family)
MLLAVSHGGGYVARAVLGELATLPGDKRLAAVAAPQPPVPGFEDVAVLGTPAADPGRLLAGVDDVVIFPVPDRTHTERVVRLVESAAGAGVRRIHFISRVGADRALPVCLVRWAGYVETAVRASGLPHTVLRCAPFMQNVRFFVEGQGDDLHLVGPFRDATFPWIDARDVGEILRGCIATPCDGAAVCQLGGPDDVGFDTIATWLGEALGRPVPFEDVSGPEMEGVLARRGIDPRLTRTVIEYWDYVVSGVTASRSCPAAAERLGHAPRRLRAYLAELADTLRADGALETPPRVNAGRSADVV